MGFSLLLHWATENCLRLTFSYLPVSPNRELEPAYLFYELAAAIPG